MPKNDNNQEQNQSKDKDKKTFSGFFKCKTCDIPLSRGEIGKKGHPCPNCGSDEGFEVYEEGLREKQNLRSFIETICLEKLGQRQSMIENYTKMCLRATKFGIDAVDPNEVDKSTLYSIDTFFDRYMADDIRPNETIYCCVNNKKDVNKLQSWLNIYNIKLPEVSSGIGK